MEFNTPVVVMEIYMELEIMIWIFVVCGDDGDDGDFAIWGDYGDDGDDGDYGDFAIWDTMIVCSNIYLREDGE